MARSFFEALTTPPPPRPPGPKYPLFTKKFQSTTSFSPGHIVGAGVLVIGIVGLAKFFIEKGHAEAASNVPPHPPRKPGDEPKLAQVQNERGQYGIKP